MHSPDSAILKTAAVGPSLSPVGPLPPMGQSLPPVGQTFLSVSARKPELLNDQLRPRDLLALFLASLATRMLITAATLAYTGMSLNQFAHLYDANSYIITA